MIRFRKKIYRRYSDFFNRHELLKTKGLSNNISITDLDAKGHLVHPKAPCVVTTIDPEYTQNADRHGTFYKFNVKTDILRLREITRKKIILYVMQQRALENDREQQFQTMVYQHIKNFIDMASQQLNAIKETSFSEMLAEYEKLKKLQCLNLSDELKECVLNHQKLFMEVKDFHKRSRFLLKLIGYFDIKEDTLSILTLNPSSNAGDLIFLRSDMLPDDITKDQITKLNEFLDDVVRPYIQKRSYLHEELWIAGYENTCRKLFDFYHQYTRLAVLNHVVSIVHEKFMKFHNNRISKPLIHKTPRHLKERTNRMQVTANVLLKRFEEKLVKSTLYGRIKGVAPVMLEKIQENEKKEQKQEQNSVIAQLEDIHSIVMGLLTQLDNLNPALIRTVEQVVRKRMEREKKASQKVLVKVNRFHNWIEHYQRH